jgi:DnaJ-class molecular chaperone
MTCPDCHGKGTFTTRGVLPINPDVILKQSGPCLRCKGQGIVYCCEGDRADQPSHVMENPADDT